MKSSGDEIVISLTQKQKGGPDGPPFCFELSAENTKSQAAPLLAISITPMQISNVPAQRIGVTAS